MHVQGQSYDLGCMKNVCSRVYKSVESWPELHENYVCPRASNSAYLWTELHGKYVQGQITLQTSAWKTCIFKAPLLSRDMTWAAWKKYVQGQVTLLIYDLTCMKNVSVQGQVTLQTYDLSCMRNISGTAIPNVDLAYQFSLLKTVEDFETST